MKHPLHTFYAVRTDADEFLFKDINNNFLKPSGIYCYIDYKYYGRDSSVEGILSLNEFYILGHVPEKFIIV